MPNIDFELLLRELAAEFQRRGMHGRLRQLRVYYGDYLLRRQAVAREGSLLWTEQTVLDWCGSFDLLASPKTQPRVAPDLLSCMQTLQEGSTSS